MEALPVGSHATSIQQSQGPSGYTMLTLGRKRGKGMRKTNNKNDDNLDVAPITRMVKYNQS